MCFSPVASFIASGALSVIGVASIQSVLRRGTKARGELVFASIPLVFAAQQLVEGVVWLSFGASFCSVETAALINSVSTYLYLVFAFLLWPILVPFAVLLMEKDVWRQRLLGVLSGIGIAVSSYLLYHVLYQPVSSEIFGHSIRYTVGNTASSVASAMWYVLATCGAYLLSSHSRVRWFGVFYIVALAIAYHFWNATWYSVWCFFSAALSVGVVWHVHRDKPFWVSKK